MQQCFCAAAMFANRYMIGCEFRRVFVKQPMFANEYMIGG